MQHTIASSLCLGTLGLAFLAGAGAGYEPPTADQPAASAHKVATVGEKAPDFTLKDTQGNTHVLSDYTEQGKIVVLEWFNPGCPWVHRHHTQVGMIETTQAEFKDDNVVWLAINSGAPGAQGSGAEANEQARRNFEMAYPILLDESGEVGKRYGAKTTPHMYVIDKEGVLRYKGAVDNYRDVNELGQRDYVKEALTAILAGETIEVTETRPYGCAVKYKG